ncbi:MAG: acetate--CoA ligase family protein [Pseudomonadota bacterium]
MNKHRLDPLLKPASIALVGVSARESSPGNTLARMLLDSDYRGDIYLVNPAHSKILETVCYSDLEKLPVTVDHVVIALGNKHLEQALKAAIEHGARAATIYSSGILESDSDPVLIERLRLLAKDAGMDICGLNGMGFYNQTQDLYVGIFPRPEQMLKGHISYIAQSGSAFTTYCHASRRLGFNLCVSSGNELTTTVADYMDWSLEQADTRVVGLFLETVRDPDAFVAALKKALRLSIPVVVLKIGKSPQAAAMALTHTGAIAGNHAVFQALFQRYGVIEVNSLDEMAAVMMLMQIKPELSPGGLAAVFESGGFRELVADQASQIDLEFAPLEDDTKLAIQPHLDPGLKAENPLDAWGSPDQFEARFEACLTALMEDPNVAAGAFISNLRDDYYLSEAIFRVTAAVSQKTRKPVSLATCFSDLPNQRMRERAFQIDLPFIDNMPAALVAFKKLFAYREFCLSSQEASPGLCVEQALLDSWKSKLSQLSAASLSEADSLSLLSDFSIPVVEHAVVTNETDLLAAAEKIGYPLVLKTAESGINHKSDSHGVFVNILDDSDLRNCYQDLCHRLGNKALVAAMIGESIEVALGIVNDAQFGPIIMVAAGGILVELLSDRAVALCPVSENEADDLLKSLKINTLLEGVRGKKPVKRDELINAIVALSQLAYEMREEIAEIDINPVLANEASVCAVDALILRKSESSSC